MVNGKKVKTINGDCTSYNVIYCIRCALCSKHYVGRSVRRLNVRIGEHRRDFYNIASNKNNMLNSIALREDDKYAVAYHLIDVHNLKSDLDFPKVISAFLLDICAPKYLESQEFRFIHGLKTLRPQGINIEKPFDSGLL